MCWSTKILLHPEANGALVVLEMATGCAWCWPDLQVAQRLLWLAFKRV